MPRLSRSILARSIAVAGAAAMFMSGLTGCVNQQQYDQLYDANRALEDRNVRLQQDLEAKENQLAILRDRIREGDRTVSTVQERNASLNAELVRLRENYRNLGERLDSASLGVLDPKVDNALRRMAQRHPNIVTYDASRGMIQFASDLTFASGSVDVQPEAIEGLKALADILATSEAGEYDLRIVGHTDNVPIGRPETRQRHPTNRHLSVHRAISVQSELRKLGVEPERVEVAGWGEFRPIVQNPTRGGARENRRVEIYLVPSTGGSVYTRNAEPEPTRTRQQTQVREDPMK